MNTEYRQKLPMFADISAYAGPRDPRPVNMPPSELRASHAGHLHQEPPSQPRKGDESADDRSALHDDRSPSNEVHGAYFPEAPLDLLCSDNVVEDPPPFVPARDGYDSDITDRLLDDIDHLLASADHPAATQNQSEQLYWEDDMQRQRMKVDAEPEFVEREKLFLNDFWPCASDDDPTLVPTFCWDEETGQFVIVEDEHSPLVRTPIEEMFVEDGDNDLEMGDYFDAWQDDDGAQTEEAHGTHDQQFPSESDDDDDNEGAESEQGMVVPPFSEGRALLLGLGSYADVKEEESVKFEWHPYRLG
ncbi:hypothetical protein EXIGLDRAFT_715996 [Exidia glandulosa HHB12029]|uniref:Transcription factor Iwr1 domain-containing protein n=1 Tax=Exidia glandulosa HHB12029 TaxID=1314781 RepID=A0A165QRB6_EXIGL|nr:hypothetical protein EXIGLDRAFT_715996 [Exidia glandulosa HHB12029]